MRVTDVLPRDAIPSIDDPSFGTEYFGSPDDQVIVVEGTPPRAYPIRILSYHEVVNDVLDGGAGTSTAGESDRGDPVAVTWCPICWSAVVYDRVVDGRTLTFGVSGKLADDALVLYDRETETEWKQPTGQAIAGELTGAELPARPSPMMSWARFRDEHPDGIVLRPVRGTGPRADATPAEIYDMSRYEDYVEQEAFGLHGMRGEGQPRTWGREDLDPKAIVLGVEIGGETVGYPLPRVEAAGGVVTDSVGGRDIVVFTAEGGLHAFENPGHVFELRNGRIQADGTTWDGITGRSADGRRLLRVPARRLFAFAWQDAHGPDAFYRG